MSSNYAIYLYSLSSSFRVDLYSTYNSGFSCYLLRQSLIPSQEGVLHRVVVRHVIYSCHPSSTLMDNYENAHRMRIYEICLFNAFRYARKEDEKILRYEIQVFDERY